MADYNCSTCKYGPDTCPAGAQDNLGPCDWWVSKEDGSIMKFGDEHNIECCGDGGFDNTLTVIFKTPEARDRFEELVWKERKINLRAICDYVGCSDGDDKQYPECSIQDATLCSVNRFLRMKEIAESEQESD